MNDQNKKRFEELKAKETTLNEQERIEYDKLKSKDTAAQSVQPGH